MANAPDTFNGKAKIFEEIFVSPFEKKSKSDALKVLDSIRRAHPASSGWVEIEGFVEQKFNGLWHAVRHHAKYG